MTGRGFPTRSRTGSACRPRSRSFRGQKRSWSRLSRAGSGTISSATRSREGSRIRASACCSRGGSSGPAPRRSASSPTNMRSPSGGSTISARWCRDGRLDLAQLFDEDMLGDDLDAWLAESSLMKRSFRVCAIISGLIERRHPGQEKTGRQMTASSDLIYDVLRQHEPEPYSAQGRVRRCRDRPDRCLPPRAIS